jgi:dipeptidase E
VSACRPILQEQAAPTVAYLPEASIGERYVGMTKVAFKGLADVVHINVEKNGRAKIDAALDKASLLYIPGGNTYLLTQRLHDNNLLESIRERVRNGLPLVAFSAGTVLCGANILTTNDLNCCGCTTFSGLALVPFNFNVHYPQEDGHDREERDYRLWEYHAFQDNPVLAVEDSAHLRVVGEKLELVTGDCWLVEKGKQRVKVDIGTIG